MDKVISSDITRSFNKSNDVLYELLKVVPAKPIAPKPGKSHACDFQPRNDKQYIPKKKNRQMVKTVRDIRNLFEKDVLSELPAELEKQQNYLLRKIKGGFLREEKTKSVAKNMLNCDKPLTKSSWQMLMNINPENHAHCMQYVVWNGKSIRINGSKGGKYKFIYKFDLGKRNKTLKTGLSCKKYNYFKKKGLLQNSLSVDFKPGPLACKKFLDNSFQKYHVGHIDVVSLPKPGLEIQPLYGCALEPTISSFVNKLREESGAITPKWAEFAVSVLGRVNGTNVSPIDRNSSVTFNLNYKHDQKKLLVRRDIESMNDARKKNPIVIHNQLEKESDVLPEVQAMMEGILDAVDIHVSQDDMYKEDDEIREKCQVNQSQSSYKEKLKRRYCELDRLDVTVIRLDENESDVGSVHACNNSFCTLGCVCSSLQSTVLLKGHCGRIECMFECKCDFSKYATVDALNSDCVELLPSLFNLKNEINGTLSKEEQKFHQTVIVSGDKSILLKSKKRTCKSAKKYEDYYNTACSKAKSNVQRVPMIYVPKLNCINIEPWCMVHNLYKCFCKGRFTDSMSIEVSSNDANKIPIEIVDDVEDKDEKRYKESKKDKYDYSYKTHPNRTRGAKSNVDYSKQIYDVDSDEESYSCARLTAFEGRKFSENYYSFTNNKIKNMEINDDRLRKRLQRCINNSCDNTEYNTVRAEDISNTEKIDNVIESENVLNSPIAASETNLVSNSPKITLIEESPPPEKETENLPIKPKITMVDESSADKSILSKPKLVAWLETSYQDYKRRLDLGVLKTTLEPPKKGKVALYQWDFILNRYSERKNLFLVSRQAPYRIFMAVNMNNPLFENCMNIDDIRFADLNKYPTTVKNLLTNTKNMKDYFCILYGYNHCWEFIGTVTKVSDQRENNLEDEMALDSQNPGQVKIPKLLVDLDAEATITISSAIQEMSPTPENAPKQSKWFIMSVENDFSEIQFYNRGFFVKHSSIVKAINVARMSGKTVRLSSQKCAENISDGTQFGIYAIPNANEYCVFIGPYEVNESLGVETVKTISNIGKRKRTRGVWITTDKVDNLKVIDNPLSFMPSQQLEYNDLITMENNVDDLCTSTNSSNNIAPADQIKNAEIIKIAKPIKISKTNSFYHIGSNALIKTVSVLQSPIKQLQGVAIKPKTFILKSSTPTRSSTNLTAAPAISDTSSSVPSVLSGSECQPKTSPIPPTNITSVKVSRTQNRPVAEVAPQIKIAAVYSECDPEKTVPPKRKEGGMFVLKPEEINQRLIIDGNKSPKAGSSISVPKEETEITMDIEHFLDTSNICQAPESETFVISDDEEIPPSITCEEIKEVYIECTNIENLGALRGEIHSTKGVRFDFPGFNVSEYYKSDEVFSKINQVLSRRVYVPDHLKLEWRIVNSMSELKTQRLLKKESFGSMLIMTPKGIQKKAEIQIKRHGKIKTYLNKNKQVTARTRLKQSQQSYKPANDQIKESSQEFEKESTSLETENNELFLETVTKKSDILKSIAEASDADRHELASVLKDIEFLSTVED